MNLAQPAVATFNVLPSTSIAEFRSMPAITPPLPLYCTAATNHRYVQPETRILEPSGARHFDTGFYSDAAPINEHHI